MYLKSVMVPEDFMGRFSEHKSKPAEMTRPAKSRYLKWGFCFYLRIFRNSKWI